MDARAVVERWLDAMEDKDPDATLACLADDVTMRAEALAQPLRGQAFLRASIESFLKACESIRLEREKIVAEGHDVAVLLRTRAKLRSDVEVLGEKLPTAGKDVRALVAVFVVVNDAGRISEVTRVRDTWEVMRQLGISADRMRSLVDKVERAMAGARPS